MKIANYEFVHEYRFHPVRKWRFDWACPELKIAIEIEGGAFSNGRHTRGRGFINDMEKYNNAVLLGWKLLRYTPEQFNNYLFISDIETLIKENN